jgi:ABC-type multidrug transport system fused ATPase/permease subunit
MYGPAKKLSRVNANLQQAIAASERIFEMLDTHTEVVEQPARRRSRRSSTRSSSATSASATTMRRADSAHVSLPCAPGR